MPNLADWLLMAFATWRLSSLAVRERGPWRVFQRLREQVGIQHSEDGQPVSWPDGGLGQFFACLWCFSLWSAPVVYLVWEYVPFGPVGVFVLAVSGLAILVERHGRDT